LFFDRARTCPNPQHYLEDILGAIDMILSIDQFNFGIEGPQPKLWETRPHRWRRGWLLAAIHAVILAGR
jgi:hypothetical protein